MFKSLAAIAGATIIVGCATAYAGGGTPNPVAQAPVHTPIACAINGTKIGGGIRLEAIVTAGQPYAGTYELVVAKSGPAGSSDISQGGEFAVEPGRTAVLGGSELSLERGSRLTARLLLKTASGETGCVAEF